MDSLRRLISQKHDLQANGLTAMLRWYHDLGGMLYFPSDAELGDIVILNPWLVNQLISRVMDHPDDTLSRGILEPELWSTLWPEWAAEYRWRLVRLMEKFDLAFRIPDSNHRAVVVSRLPADPPAYQSVWEAARSGEHTAELSLHYKFNNLPAGISTAFIAREHRFLDDQLYWRHGAVLADRDRLHFALFRADPDQGHLELTVRGPYPENFFNLLRDGLELILERYDGIAFRRLVPCPCGNGTPCGADFEFDALLKARSKGLSEIPCNTTFEPVKLELLLHGREHDRDNRLLKRMEQLFDRHENRSADREQEQAEQMQRNIIEEVQREFLKFHESQAQQFENLQTIHCPNVFIIRPKERKLSQNPLQSKSVLHLFCQAPHGEWHPVDTNPDDYTITEPLEQLKPLLPYIGGLVKILKTTLPGFSLLTGRVLPFDTEKALALMEKLAQQGPDYERLRNSAAPIRADGAVLRNLHHLLKQLDPASTWGGLKRVRMPEGHYLWLCEEHAANYGKVDRARNANHGRERTLVTDGP